MLLPGAYVHMFIGNRMFYRKSEGYFIGNRMVILSEIGWFYRKSDGFIENRMILSEMG